MDERKTDVITIALLLSSGCQWRSVGKKSWGKQLVRGDIIASTSASASATSSFYSTAAAVQTGMAATQIENMHKRRVLECCDYAAGRYCFVAYVVTVICHCICGCGVL